MALRHRRSVAAAAALTALATGASVYGSPVAHADLIEDGTQLIAHRGGYDYGTENSVATLRKALERGADAIEFDVQWTKDGRTVVMHDATMNRTTNCSGTVSAISYAKFRSCKLNDGSKPPTIYEVLNVMEDFPNAHAYLHPRSLNTWAKGKKIALALERSGMNNKSRASVISNSKAILWKAKEGGFKGRRGLLFSDPRYWSAAYDTLIPYDTPVTSSLVKAAQKRGKEVVVVEGHPTGINSVLPLGLDGYMANGLGDALDVLGKALGEVNRQLTRLGEND